MRRALLLVAVALVLAGCGTTQRQASTPRAKQRQAGSPPPKQRRGGGGIPTLLAEVRPIGRGPRFQPPIRGHVPGACTTPLGRRLQVHVEIFGADRVVLLPAGIGTREPQGVSDGRILHARCFGDLVTLDPTGTVYFRPGVRLALGVIFDAWGQSLSDARIASFTGERVHVYVNGRLWPGPVREVPLVEDAEIVLELGRRVPPHTRFSFPGSPPRRLG